MNPEQIRERIERRLGFSLPDETWEYFVDERAVHKVQQRVTSLDDFEVDVKRFLRASGLLKRTAEEHTTVDFLPKSERGGPGATPSRAEAISALLADHARSNQELLRFRSELLGDRVIDPEQVEEWIKAKASEEGPAPFWLAIPMDPKRLLWGEDDFTLTVNPPISLKRLSLPYSVDAGESLEYATTGDGWVRKIPVTSGGVLDRLKALARSLSRHYGWQKAQATVFALTDRTPLVSVHSAHYAPNFSFPALSRIELVLDPALSPRQVAEFYRKARKEIVSGRYRNLSEKHTLLAAFGASHGNSPKLREKWNRQYPKWRYESESNFGRDVRAAKQRLLLADPRVPLKGGK